MLEPTGAVSGTVRTIFTHGIALVRGRLMAFVIFSLVFKAIHFAALAPLATWIMRLFLERWGRASVGNFEIASFLLSPSGLMAICCVGGITAATLYLEIAGLMQIMLLRSFSWWHGRALFAQLFQKLVRLGIIQLAITLAIVLPFAGIIYGIYWSLWQGRDLNGLIILKPAEFWWGAGLASVVCLILAACIAALYLRWLLALPILLCQPSASPLGALLASHQATGRHLVLLAKCMAIWFLIQFVAAYCLLAIVHFGLLKLLNYPWPSLSTAAAVTGIALATESLVGVLLSVAANISFAAIVLSLYKTLIGSSSVKLPSDPITSSLPPLQSPPESSWRFTGRVPLHWWLLGSSIVMVAGTIAVSYWICDTLRLKDSIELTAHRAGGGVAPENTIAALRRAIEDHSDWAEIDVQLTIDDELVVMHDTDLARIGGGTAEVGRSTLAQIRALDVGSQFGLQFKGERVPRFQEFLEVAKNKIRLNVELKPHGAADTRALTSQVVAAIQAAQMVDQCRICSQSYEGIQTARALEPKLEIGFIAATALGDSTKLDVDFLMLSHSKITRRMVERAQLRGVKIHAWTVNDPRLVLKLVDAGVANIITDDVLRIAQQLRAIDNLHPVERLLLRAKNALSDPVAAPDQ